MLHDFDQNTPGVKLGQSIHLKVYQTGLGDHTLMQFTGLKDKNGKEIYEGDILRDTEDIAKVVFEKGAFIAQVKTFGFGWKAYANLWEYLKDWKDVEVIGNIYQNPELLQ